jgi:hypothetical protein
MTTLCELCGARAVMHFYALNPGTPLPQPVRGDDPFYPPDLADFRLNCCVECFEVTAQQLRDEKYVGIRATGVIPGDYKNG